MKQVVFFLIAGLCATQALEGFVPIFSVVDEARKTVASIATDEHSNIALMGSFEGEIEIGGNKFNSSEQDIFIAKLNANHSLLWAYQIGGLQPDDAGVIKFDRQNNIVFGGKFASRSLTFQHTTLEIANVDPTSFYFDIMLSKISSNGTLMWMKNFGDVNSSSQHLSDLEILSDNSIVTCGVYYNTGYFGGERFHARSHEKARYSQSDFFVAKYSPNGDHIWSMGIGGDHEETVAGVAIDSGDNILVGATFQSSDLILDGKQIEHEPRGRDGLVIKFTPDGNHIWHKQFGSRSTDMVRAIAVDSQGDIIVAAQVSGNVTFDDVLLPTQGYQSLLLLKMSGNGEYIWGRVFTVDFIAPQQLLINFRTDQIILIGNYNSENFSLGLDYLPYTPADCLFVAEWSKDAEIVFSKGLCGNSPLHAESGALDRNTGAILVGCDLYDSSVLGNREADPEKSEIAVLQQILPESQEIQEHVHDEL